MEIVESPPLSAPSLVLAPCGPLWPAAMGVLGFFSPAALAAFCALSSSVLGEVISVSSEPGSFGPSSLWLGLPAVFGEEVEAPKEVVQATMSKSRRM